MSLLGLTLIAAFAGVAPQPQQQSLKTIDVYVKAEAGKAGRLRETLGPRSRLISRDEVSGLIRIRVPLDFRGKAQRRLAGLGLAPVRWERSPLGREDLGSRTNLNQLVERGRAEAKLRGKALAPGYLESQRQRLQLRAYPFDRIEPEEMTRGIAQMRSMDAYRPMSDSRAPLKWEYVGAKQLTVNQLQYYGPGRFSGRVNAIAYDPANSNTIYAGAATGGLWKSTDSGANWTFLSASWPMQAVNTIAMFSSNEIWVGLGDLHGSHPYGGAIMRSLDSGATWSVLGSSVFKGDAGVTGIAPLPGTGGKTVIVTTGGPNPGKIYRSEDGGSNWVAAESISDVRWTSLSVSPLTILGVRAMYAAANGNTWYRVRRSLDGGKTWTPLTLPSTKILEERNGFSVAASQVNPGVVYAMSHTEGKCYKSDNYGSSWTDISSGIPNFLETGTDAYPAGYNFKQGSYNYYLAASKYTISTAWASVTSDLLIAGNIDVAAYNTLWGGWLSIGGPTWSKLPKTHNDQHSAAFDPTNPKQGLLGNDGGLYKFSIAPLNTAPYVQFLVSNVNTGLNDHIYHHMEVHPTEEGVILAGAQDNGFQVSSSLASPWNAPLGGDGAFGHVSRLNAKVQFGSSQNFNMSRTTDGWATKTNMAPSFPEGEKSVFIGVTELDRWAENFVYAGTQRLHRYSIAGKSWTYALDLKKFCEGDQYISALASTQGYKELLIGTSDGQLFRSVDDGNNAIDKTGNLPVAAITSISKNPSDQNDVVVTMGGYWGVQVVRTTNFLDKTPVWNVVVGSGSTKLPNVHTNCIVREKNNSTNKWWVGTDLGVFVTSDSGRSWLNATTSLGLPTAEVTSLGFGPNGWMYASTYGLGIWRFKTSEPLSFGPIVFSPTVGKRGGGLVEAKLKFSPPQSTSFRLAVSVVNPVPGVTVPTSFIVPAGASTASFFINPKPATATGSFTVRVSDPSGGSMDGTLKIEEAKPLSLTVTPNPAKSKSTLDAVLTLDSPAASGAVFTVTEDSSYASGPATVTVPVGQTSVSFQLQTLTPPSDQDITITAGGKSAKVKLMRPRIQHLVIQPLTVIGGDGQAISGRVDTDGPVHSSGITYTITYDGTGLTGPSTVTIPGGSQFSPWFSMQSSSVSATAYVKVTATQKTASGAYEASASETVALLQNGISSFTITPSTAAGGTTFKGTITLAKYPLYQTVIPIKEDSPYVAAPANVYIPIGQKSITFDIPTTLPLMNTTVPITAGNASYTKSASITLLWNGVKSLTSALNTLSAGQSTTMTVTLAAPAPSNGASVTISVPGTSPLTAPASIIVPAGKLSQSFVVTAKSVTTPVSVPVSAFYLGTSQSINILVKK